MGYSAWMVHGSVYLIFAALLAWVSGDIPPLTYAFLYPAFSFAVAGIAYLTSTPSLFGKRIDGKFTVASWLVFLPYHLVGALSAGMQRLKRSREPMHEIVEGIWLGERTNALPAAIERIVDLTAEHGRIGPPVANYPRRFCATISSPSSSTIHWYRLRQTASTSSRSPRRGWGGTSGHMHLATRNWRRCERFER